MANMLPNLSSSGSWVSLTAIMTSFLGMELAAVHIKQVRQPQKTFPKAILISVLIILFTMSLGSLSIAFVLPKENIHLVDGVMQTFKYFFHGLIFFFLAVWSMICRNHIHNIK